MLLSWLVPQPAAILKTTYIQDPYTKVPIYLAYVMTVVK